MVASARQRVFLFAMLLLTVAAGVAYFVWPREQPTPESAFVFDEPAPDNPQATFATPFRNVRPGIAYVGDAACEACHGKIHAAFHQHPMGRSATLASDPTLDDRYDPATKPTFRSMHGREYRVEQVGGKVVHVEAYQSFDGQTQTTTRATADIVIGSGQLGKSYLCIRDGSVWQTGISWFTSTKRWDVSPGFVPGRHATRSIVAECLFCHVNHVELVPGTINRYKEPLLGKQAAIGCERCHGPGQLHVNERLNAKDTKLPDTSIVNPKHLEPTLRDAICQQCHLQGESRVTRRGRDLFEYRPGLPLELFQAIYVKPPELVPYQKSVGQVEQVRASKCATASNGQLSCTSCHDPHAVPANKEQHYRNACMKCHTEKGCTTPFAERQAKNDSCIACHMPSGGSSSIPHASVTDHRIQRKPSAPTTAPPKTSTPFVHFHGTSKHVPDAAEQARDWGMVLGRYVIDRDPTNSKLYDQALQALQTAVQQHPSDAAAWEMLSRMRAARGQWAEALTEIKKTLAIAPTTETALQHAAQCAYATENYAGSLDYAQRAVTVNPGNMDNHLLVGNAHVQLGQNDEAVAVFRHIVDIVPSNASAHVGLAICQFRQGEQRVARTKLEQAIELDPDSASRLRDWFRQQTK